RAAASTILNKTLMVRLRPYDPAIQLFAKGMDARVKPGHDAECVAAIVKSQRSKDQTPYLIASGLTGEPTAPVIGMAGATNRNSYTPSLAQSSASSFTWKISPMVMPMIGIVIQCHGWLMPGSVSFGRTSQPQVSEASAASSVSFTKSSVSKLKPGASPPGYPSQLPALSFASICPVRTMT